MDFAIVYHRSNGGVAFVFVRIFWIKTGLIVCEIPKVLINAKLHTSRIIKATRAIFLSFLANDSRFL